MLVLCMYTAKTAITRDAVYGSIMIEVARSSDISQEFEYRMWKANEKRWRLEKISDWRLVSYLPACGRAEF